MSTGRDTYVHALDWNDDNLKIPVEAPIKSEILVNDGSAVVQKPFLNGWN
jgi:hypothetical protein